MNKSHPGDPAFPYYVADYITLYYDTVLANLSLWDNVTLYGYAECDLGLLACDDTSSPHSLPHTRYYDSRFLM